MRQQNEDTRKISAWAAIGIVPTIVAGLFGMNLGGIPLADHWLGFAVDQRAHASRLLLASTASSSTPTGSVRAPAARPRFGPDRWSHVATEDPDRNDASSGVHGRLPGGTGVGRARRGRS